LKEGIRGSILSHGAPAQEHATLPLDQRSKKKESSEKHKGAKNGNLFQGHARLQTQGKGASDVQTGREALSIKSLRHETSILGAQSGKKSKIVERFQDKKGTCHKIEPSDSVWVKNPSSDRDRRGGHGRESEIEENKRKRWIDIYTIRRPRILRWE